MTSANVADEDYFCLPISSNTRLREHLGLDDISGGNVTGDNRRAFVEQVQQVLAKFSCSSINQLKRVCNGNMPGSSSTDPFAIAPDAYPAEFDESISSNPHLMDITGAEKLGTALATALVDASFSPIFVAEYANFLHKLGSFSVLDLEYEALK